MGVCLVGQCVVRIIINYLTLLNFYSSVLSDCLTPGGASPEPRHLWSQHALPVTDIAVGKGGIRARVATSSLDNTVRVR